eukprot:771398_1
MWRNIAVSAARRATFTASKTIATKQVGALRLRTLSSMSYGESITYSGGQASEGQGGFYGSGGARVSKLETEHRPEMMALAADVESLTLLMEEVYKLDAMLK